MSGTGQLIAIADVFIESHPDFFEPMDWFYGELIALRRVEPLDDMGESPAEVRFRSDQHDLHVRFTDIPKIEPVAVRVMCEVPFLEDVAEVLTDRKYEHDWLRGLARTDRRIQLLDPAGNRIEIRKRWAQRTL